MPDHFPPPAPAHAAALSAEEWKRRYAARVMEVSGMLEHQAIEVARVGRELYDEEVREYGQDSADVWGGPEDLADQEMSCWDDDGDTP